MKIVMMVATNRTEKCEGIIRDELTPEVKIYHLRAMLAHLLSSYLKSIRTSGSQEQLKLFLIWDTGHTEVEFDGQKILKQGLPVYLSEEAVAHEYALLRARTLAPTIFAPKAT